MGVKGILLNQESCRRSERFLSRKVAMAVARIKVGLQDSVAFGDLTAERDWGWAPEYVEMMWKMLQLEVPDDFVVGSGQSHSAMTVVREAFNAAGLHTTDYVCYDAALVRPIDNRVLRADAQKARYVLGWEPKMRVPEIMQRMVAAEIAALRAESAVAAARI